MRSDKSRRRFVFLCVAPATILFFLFMILPTLNVFRMSLYERGAYSPNETFVGLKNFQHLLKDTQFIRSMQNMILLVVVVTIVTFAFALVFAAILTREKIKGQNFFRVIFYIPNILSVVVISGIHSSAFPGVMPPPTWRPPGHAARASRAARLLPGPSLITWPPCRPSLRYKSAYHAAPRSETKLVRREAPSCVREPPTICFTRPSCKSMHGLNLVTRPLCPPHPRRSRRDYPPAPSGKRARKITQNSPGPPLYRITAPEHHSRSR